MTTPSLFLDLDSLVVLTGEAHAILLAAAGHLPPRPELVRGVASSVRALASLASAADTLADLIRWRDRDSSRDQDSSLAAAATSLGVVVRLDDRGTFLPPSLHRRIDRLRRALLPLCCNVPVSSRFCPTCGARTLAEELPAARRALLAELADADGSTRPVEADRVHAVNARWEVLS